MKVLTLNRKFLVLLGVCPASSSSAWHSVFKINFSVILLLQFLGLLSSICFIVKFISIDLNSVLYAGFHTSAYSTSTYSLLVGFMVQHKIFRAFQKLQDIYDESKLFLYFKFECKVASSSLPNLEREKNISISTTNQSHQKCSQSSVSDKVNDSSTILAEANENGRWITMIATKYLTLGYFLASILLAALSALYSFYTNGYIAVEQLYYPFKFM